MAQNKIADLNNHLFAQLERLNDETIKPEKMELEIKKAAAVSKVASQIINANKLVLDAAKIIGNGVASTLPETFGVKQIGG
ncbi:hypothetical protein [Mucilaginibacter sp. SP1R1]|uniref:hypothetical protein n=1 Tax=Mucilaginibacter sp. SP1R1 TaxID=2723091 RepID=UPI0016222893|nr:hypothetical protein [Mucilaginibacter sp. SP1R1]MBB6149443.1 hypothetical protein [Mucilaginibacter sp. SP1R1]